MTKEELQYLVNINSINNVNFNGQHDTNSSTIGYFKDDNVYHAYQNDKNGVVIKCSTMPSENDICNKLAFDFLSIAKFIDPKNLDKPDQQFFCSILSNFKLYEIGINKNNKISRKNTKDLIRFITNCRMNQIKLLSGKSINDMINNQKKIIDSAKNYAQKNYYEMLYDSIIIAYYNNINGGIILNKKLYLQKMNSDEYRIVDSEIKKLQLKK